MREVEGGGRGGVGGRSELKLMLMIHSVSGSYHFYVKGLIFSYASFRGLTNKKI